MDDDLLKKTKSARTRTVMIVVVLALFAAAFFIGFRIMGPGAGSGKGTDDKKGGSGSGGTITISIDCKSLAEDMSKLTKPELKEYIPEDGVILPKEKYDFNEGESVYDALEAVCLADDIQIESSEDSLYKSRYVEGINYLYEKDGGKMSGWLFSVNGEIPNYGASKVKLKDGDEIRWFYTVNYNEDSNM